MTQFWASFAANDVAQPTGGREAWPAYMYRDDATAAKSNTMQLDIELEVRDTEAAVSLSPRVLPQQCSVRAPRDVLTPQVGICHAFRCALSLSVSLSVSLFCCRFGVGLARIQGRRLSVLGARAAAKTYMKGHV